MGNLFYEQLEKDYELGDVKEEFLSKIAECVNNCELGYEIVQLIDKYPQLYSIDVYRRKVKYNG